MVSHGARRGGGPHPRLRLAAPQRQETVQRSRSRPGRSPKVFWRVPFCRRLNRDASCGAGMMAAWLVDGNARRCVVLLDAGCPGTGQLTLRPGRNPLAARRSRAAASIACSSRLMQRASPDPKESNVPARWLCPSCCRRGPRPRRQVWLRCSGRNGFYGPPPVHSRPGLTGVTAACTPAVCHAVMIFAFRGRRGRSQRAGAARRSPVKAGARPSSFG